MDVGKPKTEDIFETEDISGWHEIGIHRSIASFWYQFVLLLLAAAPGLLMYGYIIPNFILPYPDALGYQSFTVTFFAVLFDLMDVATKPACERFVAQYAEINPKKALKYVQFFMYFQMFTGLIQITTITIFCFTYIIHTSLNYALWFFLFYSTTQFPGMLAAYTSTLKGYQRFDKSNIVEIIQGVLFENVTQVFFILIGRLWGANNPALGELMGATIGFILGKYIDDFFAMGLAAYYVSKILEPYGIRLRETIIPTFTVDEAKESLLYGVKLLGSTVISRVTDFITLTMMISWVPNYISIIGYLEVARAVASAVTVRYNFTALLAQAYNNGKKKLAQYVITRYVSHWWYFAFFLSLEISILVPTILEYLGGEWGRAAWIIPIYIFPRLLVTPPCIGADILQACDRPMYRTYGIISEKITKMICVFLFLSPWGLPAIFGEGVIIILYILHDIPAYIVITIVEFALIHYKVVPVKINWWQTFMAGTLGSVPLIPINILMINSFIKVWEISDTLVIPVILISFYVIIMLFSFPMLIFFFIGLFGGWDDATMDEFKRAEDLCGPSKFFFAIFVKMAGLGHKYCPFRNKFATSHKEAYEEIDELMQIVVKK
ncbi:MAG: hypothetical protein GF364_11460 [Candidatus Lokiarchaeota archaeon]|nr:hypothetical protein [Candidatus Lokiarchaeota archaeon]